ncbi:hypothetical protein H6F88_32010 [Oculatella sp. FACHB-28]|uniref:hypothetical protein n=1 Tax=Cyanophyceae TaxID=3028117 RepID=UPI001684D1C1|nr:MULTISPECIES: hypothetical protein [Cyanophyceae]MBD1866187.1 hypothetical protein [Cyanobacteria bacterium FACHB-471]MBD1997559.1 hypothetical protein [Leptolyngbya sp. FACHB-541]MBD2060570.1 hypothetical protein [Oculatella sp. FACHB-28]
MPYQNISATLTDEKLKEIKTAIATIQTNMPFLVNLTTDERRKRFKMGDKSLAFVNNSLSVTQNNSEIVPANFDIAEFAKDYQLMVALTEILSLLEQLTEKVDDTLVAVGSESMASSLLVYDYVKTAAKHTPGLKSVADQLGERFKAMGNRRPKSDKTSASGTV